jgi:nucleotide-binding universal stress UspA family protein
MAGSIICGVDDSESAKGAARVARGLGAQLGMRLVFVRVVEDGSSTAKISTIAGRLQHLVEGATDVDCGAHWLVDVGHPADRLVAAAAAEDASLIVVGSTGPRSSLLGSISADLSRRAPCPVVVVAPGADGSFPNGSGGTQSANGHSRTRDTSRASGFPDPFDDDYNEVAGGVPSGLGPTGSAKKDDVINDPTAPDFDGGIVRFSLGGRRDGS